VLDKVVECFLAPLGSSLPAADMRVIDRDGWHQVITPSTKSTQGNEVMFSRVAAGDAERVVRETIADYAQLRLPFKWNVGPLTEPADFGAVLERFGFTSWPTRGMVVEPQRWTAAAHDRVTVQRVTRDSFDDHYRCLVEGWSAEVSESSSWYDSMLRALDAGRHHMYSARVDGEVAGTAGFITRPRSVYLVGGNVLERYRGRGVYRALVDARLRDVAALGFVLATTQAREATSAPILDKLGFETVYRARVYKWEP
jgi:hypothetical protein